MRCNNAGDGNVQRYASGGVNVNHQSVCILLEREKRNKDGELNIQEQSKISHMWDHVKRFLSARAPLTLPL